MSPETKTNQEGTPLTPIVLFRSRLEECLWKGGCYPLVTLFKDEATGKREIYCQDAPKGLKNGHFNDKEVAGDFNTFMREWTGVKDWRKLFMVTPENKKNSTPMVKAIVIRDELNPKVGAVTWYIEARKAKPLLRLP